MLTSSSRPVATRFFGVSRLSAPEAAPWLCQRHHGAAVCCRREQLVHVAPARSTSMSSHSSNDMTGRRHSRRSINWCPFVHRIVAYIYDLCWCRAHCPWSKIRIAAAWPHDGSARNAVALVCEHRYIEFVRMRRHIAALRTRGIVSVVFFRVWELFAIHADAGLVFALAHSGGRSLKEAYDPETREKEVRVDLAALDSTSRMIIFVVVLKSGAGLETVRAATLCCKARPACAPGACHAMSFTLLEHGSSHPW